MEISEFINQILLPFGGVSVVLVALATFLGNVNTKRIVNGDLAKHKLELEAYKTENSIKLQAMKDRHSHDLELLRLEYSKEMDLMQSTFKTEFLRYETYTSISKEKYQHLFDRRVSVYESLLSLKKEIEDSVADNAEWLEIHDDDPSHFTDAVKKINEITQSNAMLISNNLAVISNELYEKSSQVFSNARVASFFAEIHGQRESQENYQAVMNAENDALRKMFSECGDLYGEWFKQLDVDLSTIRGILDFTGDFLTKGTNKQSQPTRTAQLL